ncbi:MAG TPA: arginine N-succinyltransferase [Anaeromyxobacteraceae bacterium]|nr:arginine N-succinyltransferase [Anaeromyxobacteraceae bacterium]
MLLLRDAHRGDLKQLKALSALLDSVNLPHDERALAGIIDVSARSFAGAIRNPLERVYLFVLENAASGKLVGTSMLIAQHGTRESPCTFFNVDEREHYSSTLDKHFRHKVLSIGYHFDGPTEIGGLVVHPGQRRTEHKPGKQLSFVRFLYIAMFRDRFRDAVLAELMPPLLAGGKSLFWESCGKRFTGLDYHEADKLSRVNKEFIQQLFPPYDIYATLLPPRVQRALGKVGPETEGVRVMLERLGFRYVDRIDPFDGGPHFEAHVADIPLVREHRRLRVSDADLPAHLEPLDAPELLVGVSRPRARVHFRAVRAPARVLGEQIALPPRARELLGVAPGDRVHSIPFTEVVTPRER